MRDAFIELEPTLDLPPVVIASEASLSTPVVSLGALTVTNTSTFPYGIRIAAAPRWLLCADDPEWVEPGTSATLRVGVDPRAIPPGESRVDAQLLVSGPFLRRSYPIDVHATVRYPGPAPRIESRTEEGPDGERLFRLSVTNAGGGLLQGHCYEPDTNRRHEFLLAGGGDAYRLSKVMPARDRDHTRIVVICDCINDRLRMQEIFPELERPLGDAPFLDFTNPQAGGTRTFDLGLNDVPRATRVTVDIPEELRHRLTFQFTDPLKVRFTLVPGAKPTGSFAGHVTFAQSDGVRRKVPILIAEEPVRSGSRP